MRIKVTVFRFDPAHNGSPVLENYGVPYTPGMTLLDALMFIQSNFDPTLAFRWECRKATCGSCAVMLNGRPVPACQTRLDPQIDTFVTPLANFPVIKDLVVDLQPALDRLSLVKPYLVPNESIIRSKTEADLSRRLRSCIECWACVAVCPVPQNHPSGTADPVGMVQLARFALDKRDALDRRGKAIELGLDKYNCADCQQCVGICPKQINIPEDSISVLRSKS